MNDEIPLTVPPTEEELNRELQKRMKLVLEAKKALIRGNARIRTEKLRLDTEIAELKEAVVTAQQAVDVAQECLLNYQLGDPT